MFYNFLTFISAKADGEISGEISKITSSVVSTLTGVLAGVLGIISLMFIVKMIVIGVKIAKANKDGESTNGAKEDLKRLGIGLGILLVGVTLSGAVSGVLTTAINKGIEQANISPEYSNVAYIEQSPDTQGNGNVLEYLRYEDTQN